MKYFHCMEWITKDMFEQYNEYAQNQFINFLEKTHKNLTVL